MSHARVCHVGVYFGPARKWQARGFKAEIEIPSTDAKHRPGIGNPVTARPWITGVEHVLVSTGNPRAPADLRADRGRNTDRSRAEYPAAEFRTDDRYAGETVFDPHFAAGMRADTAVPDGERSSLPGWIATTERARISEPLRSSAPANRQKE